MGIICRTQNLQLRDTQNYGMGVFAGENIKRDQIIYVLSGEIISFDECVRRVNSGEEIVDDPLQIGRKLYLDLDYISHAISVRLITEQIQLVVYVVL
jgi:hypothetical protein